MVLGFRWYVSKPPGWGESSVTPPGRPSGRSQTNRRDRGERSTYRVAPDSPRVSDLRFPLLPVRLVVVQVLQLHQGRLSWEHVLSGYSSVDVPPCFLVVTLTGIGIGSLGSVVGKEGVVGNPFRVRGRYPLSFLFLPRYHGSFLKTMVRVLVGSESVGS